MYWPKCAPEQTCSFNKKKINQLGNDEVISYMWFPFFCISSQAFWGDVEVVEWHFYRNSETTIRAVSPCVEWWGNATETYESSRQKNETVLSWSKPAVLHIWVMRGGRDPQGFSMVGTIFHIHQYDYPLSTNG